MAKMCVCSKYPFYIFQFSASDYYRKFKPILPSSVQFSSKNNQGTYCLKRPYVTCVRCDKIIIIIVLIVIVIIELGYNPNIHLHNQAKTIICKMVIKLLSRSFANAAEDAVAANDTFLRYLSRSLITFCG